MMDRAAATEHPETLTDAAPRPPGEDPVALGGVESFEGAKDGPQPSEPAAEQPTTPEAPPPSDEASLPSLEQRVRKLEDTLAELQDTQYIEERVVRRVLEEVHRGQPESPGPVVPSAALVIDAGRQILPAAVGALQAHAAAVEARARNAAPAARPPWLIVELWADARTLARMSRDPLYRTIWLGRVILPLGLVAAIFTSWIWLNLLPGFALLPGVVSGLLIKVVDLFLAFVLCKVLQREIRRYREAVPDQAPVRRP